MARIASACAGLVAFFKGGGGAGLVGTGGGVPSPLSFNVLP